MSSDRLKRHVTLRNLNFIFSLIMFVWLIWYFYTSYGGPVELASYLVPIALIIQMLFMYEAGYLYKGLPPLANHILLTLYIGICLLTFYHFMMQFEEIAIWRQGSYTRMDYMVGLLVFLLVMELSRLVHPTLFWINLVLVVYTIWGHLSPLDFFWHPGTTFYRVVTSSTVEFSTGIFGLYSQMALTLVAAFLLLAAVARGFEAQSAMVMVMRRIAGKSRHTIPQTAVLASVSVGMVSGSGSANAAVTGSFTIPLMMRYGVPGAFAAAVETAASMGGLIMPPLMAVAGFLMSEFLGVPYWEVVKRGFAIAFVYFVALSLAIYLLSIRLLPTEPIKVPDVALYDKVKTAIFFLAIGYLAILMGWLNYGALLAALYTNIFMFIVLLLAFLYFKYHRKDPAVEKATIFSNIRLTIETHARMTAFLTLLLATLGIMIGLFTVTGFINRMGAILLGLGSWSIIATILMAWAFGWLAGAGLPPTATYIIMAIIVVDPLRQLGIDPWVAHFFAFLIAIWGELSPPTSLTAAITAQIANASFMRTMWEAVKLCLPITLMSFAVFTRPGMVGESGWTQVADTLLVTISTCGIATAMFGRFFENRGTNFLMRAALILVSFIVMFHPDMMRSGTAAVFLLPAMVLGVFRHRRIGPPKRQAVLQTSDQPESAQ